MCAARVGADGVCADQVDLMAHSLAAMGSVGFYSAFSVDVQSPVYSVSHPCLPPAPLLKCH